MLNILRGKKKKSYPESRDYEGSDKKKKSLGKEMRKTYKSYGQPRGMKQLDDIMQDLK